jgi:hypothetical protein
MRTMALRDRAPRQRSKRRAHAWIWVLLALGVIGAAVYWYWPDIQYRYLLPRSGTAFSSSLNTICAANVYYQYSHPRQGYASSLQELGPQGGNYFDSALASGEKSGYRYEYVARPEPSGRIEHYRVTARPMHYGSEGKRSYYTDEGCEVHWTDEDRAATALDPVLAESKK